LERLKRIETAAEKALAKGLQPPCSTATAWLPGGMRNFTLILIGNGDPFYSFSKPVLDTGGLRGFEIGGFKGWQPERVARPKNRSKNLVTFGRFCL
jgi:hypothetical protein